MGLSSCCANLCVGLTVSILLSVLYWYLLYHTSWAYPIAIFSLVFFGLSILGHIVSALMALMTLCTTGAIALLSCTVGGILSCFCVGLVGVIIAFFVVSGVLGEWGGGFGILIF